MSLPDGHHRLFKRTYSLAELLADGIIHTVAIVAGLLAYAVLLAKVLSSGDSWIFLAMTVYAAGFFLMFGFSLAYNMAPVSQLKWILRRFDHAAIFIMIAGTYTALLSAAGLTYWTRWLLAFVWIGAGGGVLLKFFLPGRLDRLSIVFFLVLGWSGAFALQPLSERLPVSALTLLVAGGLTYVAGVGFYLWENLRFQNAIWHSFVAAASALQFAAVALALDA
jgi:hemolysin III